MNGWLKEGERDRHCVPVILYAKTERNVMYRIVMKTNVNIKILSLPHYTSQGINYA